MFKTILRTLSALSIVTITASAGFAQNEPPASVTTDVWKKGFGSPDKQPSISPKEIDDTVNNQFLAPNANWADNADGPAHDEIDLNFDTTDDNVVNPTTLGTAVFYRGHNSSLDTYNHHAGILGNADLGAPLTETLGWVEWSGTIKAVGLYDIDKAFTLRVTFPGTIAGIVRQRGDYHYKIDGNFDSKGVIIGTVEYALFNITPQGELALTPEGEFISIAAGRVEGRLRGLIGENGALGVFHSVGGRSSGYAGYAGGFSATWDSLTHKGSLARCTKDPFDDNCDSDGFKEHRKSRIEYCIEGGNAETEPETCHKATIFSSCVIDPFNSTCNTTNFPALIKARLNRAKFCNNSANDANVRRTLCTEPRVVTGVCTDDPFNTICGTDYGPARISRCRTSQTANDCTATIATVCSDDPFDPFCGDVYDDARLEACRNGKQEGNSCASAHVSVICGDNPFNVLCEASSYDGARLEFCRDGRQKKDSDCSAGLVSMICGDNPFNTLCEADYGVERVELIKRCVRHRSDKTCMGAISTIDRCETKPFTDTQFCELGVFDTARVNLINRCTDDDMTNDTGCPAVTHVITACEANPFGANCGFDAFENRRVTLIERCYADSTGEGCAVINPVINDCNANPFGANCGFDAFDDKRNARITFCLEEGNAIDPRCTTADTDITLTFKGSLNLANASFDGTLLGGDAADGVGFVSVIGDSGYDYAGILDDTNLGAPVSQTSGSVEWVGEFKVINSGNLYSSDFTLIVDFAGTDTTAGSVSAYIPSVKPVSGWGTNLNPFKIAGTFDSNGVISGYVRHGAGVIADTTDVSLEGRGKLTGLIGREGAVGAFVAGEGGNYAGGFVVRPVVNFANWVRSFGDTPPPLVPDTVNPRDQFLQGTADGLDNGDVRIRTNSSGVPYYYDLNLNTATFDGLELDGDVADGVAWFYGASYKDYAGIFSGTDLGAPVTETAGTAKWYGQFQSGSWFSGDFTLEIDFNAESTGTVAAFVYNGWDANYYLLDGTFDRNGVISGTVDWGWFPNHDRIVDANIYDTSVLTGLIGAEGAVGVFVGDSVGGFVASSKSAADAFFSDVKFSDWVKSFNKTPYPNVPYNETQQTRFLQAREGSLDVLHLYDWAQPNPLTLADINADGEHADGVVYMFGTQRRDYNYQTSSYETITKHHYAGILSGTNLGAVLPTEPVDANGDPITATWKGWLGLIADGSEVAPRDIALTVDFTNKRISHSSVVDGAHLVDFSAKWKSGVGYDGVLKGKITYNSGAVSNSATNSPGRVTGLIGQQGAVGAFKSKHGDNHTNENTPYVGGFVAVPSAVYVQTVSFSDWVRSFGNTPRLPTSIPNRESPQTLFLRGKETGLDPYYIRRDVVRPANPLTLADVNTGERADGVAYMSGNHLNNPNNTHHVAGILSGTNLGAVLDAPVTATWRGRLGMIVNAVEVEPRDITLNVNFTNTGSNTAKSITIAYTGRHNTHFVNFNNLTWDDNGVITGGMTYNPGSGLNPATNSPGKVTGLIGQQGAVGAFISTHGEAHTNTNTPYAGGFVARPPAEPASP